MRSQHRKRTRLAIFLIAACSSTTLHGQPAPPAARIQPLTDDYFGTKVVDNYRWMEAEPEPEFRQLVTAQDEYARATLAKIPGRDRLLSDIEALNRERTTLLTVALAGGRQFYIKRAPGAQAGSLYVGDPATRKEVQLLDPASYGSGDHHATIRQFAPSQDGARVAFTLDVGGSEAAVLHVMDVATGKTLPDTIDRADAASVSWVPDGQGFVYTRLAKLPAGAPASARFDHQRVYLHRLGSDTEQDVVLIDVDHLPFSFKAAQVWPSLTITPGSRQVLAEIGDGTGVDKAFFSAGLDDLLAGRPVWKTVATQADKVTLATVHGDEVFLLTHQGAPRFKVARESLAAPNFTSAKTIVAEPRGVITNIAAASEALYLTTRAGSSSTLERVDYVSGHATSVPLPFKGTIFPPVEDAGALSADPTRPGAVFALESWLKPLRWLSYDPRAAKVTDTGLAPPFSIDLSAYDSIETAARASDGTMIPLSIVFKHGIALDHSHPTLLMGYGSFGVAMDPNFRPTLAPWLDRGGVYAVAHVRGGGELGEPWHEAGMLKNKMNTVTDFIACAEALVAMGYTSPDHLAGEGVSGGGITIGGAITQRPDLFRAALIGAGGVNALRFEQMPVGRNLIPEYGSVSVRDQFPALLAMDAYQQIRDHVPYPAVLLTEGFNDPRILAWMPAKMAARLSAATSSRHPILLRVDFDEGHGSGGSRSRADLQRADELAFLLWQLGAPEFQPRQ